MRLTPTLIAFASVTIAAVTAQAAKWNPNGQLCHSKLSKDAPIACGKDQACYCGTHDSDAECRPGNEAGFGTCQSKAYCCGPEVACKKVYKNGKPTKYVLDADRCWTADGKRLKCGLDPKVCCTLADQIKKLC